MKVMKKDIKPNDYVTTFFVLESMRMRTSRKTGRKFLSLTLRDKTGTITGYLWNDAARAAAILQEKSLVEVKGISMIQGPLIINIDHIRKAEGHEVDAKDFPPQRKYPLQQELF